MPILVPLIYYAAAAILGTAIVVQTKRTVDSTTPVIKEALAKSTPADKTEPTPGTKDIGKKETGSYTDGFASGKTYDGKGDRKRSQESGKRIEKETGDTHVSTDWTPAENDAEAFKQEDTRLQNHGGPESPDNYNKINSPGKKLNDAANANNSNNQTNTNNKPSRPIKKEPETN